MTFSNPITLSGVDLIIIGLLGVVLISSALYRAIWADSSPIDDSLSDGAVLIVEKRVIRRLSPGAFDLFGDCVGKPVGEVLGGFLGGADQKTLDDVSRLEETGDKLRRLVHTGLGEPYELIGQPSGALIRITLRDAALIAHQVETAEKAAADAAAAAAIKNWELETITALLDNAPIIAWNRSDEGRVNWSAGRMATRQGAVHAIEVLDHLIARERLQPRAPMALGQPQRSRIELVRPDTEEPASLHVIEVLGGDRNLTGFAVDASTAAAAERTLTRFVQTMTETFAHLTVGLAIFDRNQTLALFNPALVQMWQVEPTWLARRPGLREILDELRSTRRIPDLPDFHRWRSDLLGLFDNTEAADYEDLWHLADGSNVRVLARPHPHGSLAFIFDDVTEQMKLEQRYRHSIDLRRATLDRLNEGLAVFGPDGILRFVNEAFHTIWETDQNSVYPEMHARDLIELTSTLTLETGVWRRLLGFITGEESRKDWTARLILGGGRTITARFAPLPDGSTMAVFADVTAGERAALALQERNEALEAAEELRATMLDEVSHNLRTPLHTIIGFSQLLTDDRFSNLEKAQHEHVSDIHRAAQELLVSVNKVTDLASLQIDPLRDDGSELVIEDAIGVVLGHLEARARNSGIELSSALEAEVGTVHCNAHRIRQILFNVVADAVQRCEGGGTVVLGAKRTMHGGLDIWTDEFRLGAGSLPRPPLSERYGPTYSLVRRLVALEGGTVTVTEIEDPPGKRVMCRFDRLRRDFEDPDMAEPNPVGPKLPLLGSKISPIRAPYQRPNDDGSLSSKDAPGSQG